ncbi:MAG: aminotransferase class I/II-fold pyridoxal phosphate-dependent enzyme [Acidimicrobiales bacterium]
MASSQCIRSKRSNLAGGRSGFYAGDPEIINYLGEVRQHAGFLMPGPIQHASIAAFGDQTHVAEQRVRYWDRLVLMQKLVAALGVEASLPGGGFYLWVPAPDGDAWAFAQRLAEDAGILVSPGEFYGEAGAGHVRIAVVQPDEQVSVAAARVGVSLEGTDD